MKFLTFATLLALVLGVVYVNADCGDDSKSSEDGDVKQFFKSLGCKIQKGAEDLQETAKPWADKISSSAKEFGSSVAQKYDELKHKLTDDSSDATASSTPFPVANGPTEKVPLAPLGGDASNAGQPAPVPDAAANVGSNVAGKDA